MSTFKNFFIILALAAIFTFHTASTAEFGQNCQTEPADNCDGIFQYCNRWSVCDCILEQNLVYDKFNKVCALQGNANCHLADFTAGEPNCTSHATCKVAAWITDPKKGICTCDTGYSYIPEEKRCLQTEVPIGEYCEVIQYENFHKCLGFSTCQKGKCDCTVEGADVIAESDRKCALASGANCNQGANPETDITCISGSICSESSWNPAQTICTCTDLFEKNPEDRTCARKLDVGATCEHKVPIKFVQSCINLANCTGTEPNLQCQCIPDFEVKNGDNAYCKLKGDGLAGEPCYLEASTCKENAECKPRDNENAEIGDCHCKVGFQAVNGLCNGAIMGVASSLLIIVQLISILSYY